MVDVRKWVKLKEEQSKIVTKKREAYLSRVQAPSEIGINGRRRVRMESNEWLAATLMAVAMGMVMMMVAASWWRKAIWMVVGVEVAS